MFDIKEGVGKYLKNKQKHITNNHNNFDQLKTSKERINFFKTPEIEYLPAIEDSSTKEDLIKTF